MAKATRAFPGRKVDLKVSRLNLDVLDEVMGNKSTKKRSYSIEPKPRPKNAGQSEFIKEIFMEYADGFLQSRKIIQ